MKTTMANYNMKLRLFKCEKINNLRTMEKLNEVDYEIEKFQRKSKVFENYLDSVVHLIDLPVKNTEWIKGDTWHDDKIYITVEDNGRDIYYKVSHFS